MACAWAVTALAQGDPTEDDMRAVTALREQGRYVEAASTRERARQRLQGLPPEAEAYPRWVQQVAGLYAEAGRTAQARAVVLAALARLPGQKELLVAAADLWEEDQNLVQAAPYVERAGLDQRFGELYLALGRRAELAGVLEGLRWRPASLASAELQEAMDLLEEAAAGYRSVGERGDDPAVAAAAWSSLARLESRRNREAEAEEARRRSRELRPAGGAIPSMPIFLDAARQVPPASEATLREARAAALRGRVEEAFVLGLRSIGEAGTGDDDPVFMGVPLVASMLAERKARAMADTLWDRLWAVSEARQPDTMLPVLSVARAHARYLMELGDRAAAARTALGRYRELAEQAHGAESGCVVDALRLAVEFERGQGTPERARAGADELAGLCRQTRGPALRCL